MSKEVLKLTANPYITIFVLGDTEARNLLINKWNMTKTPLLGGYSKIIIDKDDKIICNVWDINDSTNNKNRMFLSNCDLCILIVDNNTMVTEVFDDLINKAKQLAHGAEILVIIIGDDPLIINACRSYSLGYIPVPYGNDPRLDDLLYKVSKSIYGRRKKEINEQARKMLNIK